MKKITTLFAVLALLGIVFPAWAQHKTREVPNAPAFNAIEVTGGDVNVYFSQGQGHAFSVSGPAKLVKAIKIKVKDNTLFIDYNRPFFTGDDDDVAVYVNAPELIRIAIAGEADFKTQTPFQGKDLVIKTRQDGEVSMKNVTVSQIKIDSKSTSSVDIDYITAQMIRVSALDRAEVEISGTTGQIEIIKKGMFAEIDTEHLVATQNPTAAATSKTGKDGSVEYVFD